MLSDFSKTVPFWDGLFAVLHIGDRFVYQSIKLVGAAVLLEIVDIIANDHSIGTDFHEWCRYQWKGQAVCNRQENLIVHFAEQHCKDRELPEEREFHQEEEEKEKEEGATLESKSGNDLPSSFSGSENGEGEDASVSSLSSNGDPKQLLMHFYKEVKRLAKGKHIPAKNGWQEWEWHQGPIGKIQGMCLTDI